MHENCWQRLLLKSDERQGIYRGLGWGHDILSSLSLEMNP